MLTIEEKWLIYADEILKGANPEIMASQSGQSFKRIIASAFEDGYSLAKELELGEWNDADHC